jgi:hypothetical protein
MTYIETPDQATWNRICALAERGPKPSDDLAEIDAWLTEVEAITNQARELIRPRSTTPAKAKMTRWVKPAPKRQAKS